jgi:23S rRNA (uracil1939-C5)-methyltransferase
MPRPSNIVTQTEADTDTSLMRILVPLYGGSFTTDTSTTLPQVLPGELVQLTPQLQILEPSLSRTEPACAHFGTCGGCHYQHADYPTQLLLKREILTNLLTAAGLTHLPEIQIEAAEPYAYRNRIRLRIEPDSNGTLRAGYSARATNAFLPITMCPIASPALWQAIETILHLAETDPLARRWLAITSELELFSTADQSKLQLHFFLRSAEAAKRESSSFPGLCDRLTKAVAQSGVPHPRGASVGLDEPRAPLSTQLTGATATLDPNLPRQSRRAWSGTTWGATGLTYPAAGRNYWLPRGAFFQVNRFLIDRLVELVTDGKTGPLAWDLYAGVGLFTRALAERFTQVIAVEGAEPAAAALATLKAPVTAVHSSTLDFLRARVLDRERPSLIVLDPPRAGLGAEAAQLLARIAAPHPDIQLVYVSCDPTTLALDLAHLTPAYEIVTLTLIDLFPQTFHIETITHLRRRKN